MTLKKFIYALGDPRTGEIYYIGASKNPVKRLYDHCNDPASSAWLRSKQIKESGLMPVLVVLEEQYTAEREYELIREFLKYGSPLTNSFVSASRSPLARSPLARPPLAARAGLEHTDRSLDFATRRRLLDEKIELLHLQRDAELSFTKAAEEVQGETKAERKARLHSRNLEEPA